MSRWRYPTSEHRAAAVLCLDLARLGCGAPDIRGWRQPALAVRDQHAATTPVHGALAVLVHVLGRSDLGPPSVAAAVGELWQALGCSLPRRAGIERGRILSPSLTPKEQALALDAAAAFPSALTPEERQQVGAPVRHVELFAMADELDRRADAASDPSFAAYLRARARLHRRAAGCAQAVLGPR